MDAKSVRNIAVTNKHTAKLHHIGSLYVWTYDARKLKHKIKMDLQEVGCGYTDWIDLAQVAGGGLL